MINIKTVEERNFFKPYGVELPPIDNTAGKTHQFTGQERDTFTNYDYMHFRFYASSMGRFLKPDNIIPDITNPQNWNAYTYVKGNPVNFNDPSGHMPIGNTGQISIDYDPGSGETSRIDDEQPQWWQVVAEMVLNYGYEATINYVLTNNIELTGKANLSEEDKNVLKLVSAQDKALIDPSFQAEGTTTHCNQATFSIIEAMGADTIPFKYSDSGNVAVANDVYRYLTNEKTRGKWKQVSESEVQNLADKGKLVIGVYKNPKGHGHLVTARPSKYVSERYAQHLSSQKVTVFYNKKNSGPYIANIGSGNPWIGRSKADMFLWFTPIH